MSHWFRTIALLTVLAGSSAAAAYPVTPPSVLPEGAVEPAAGEVLDLTPAELPGRAEPWCEPEHGHAHEPGGWFASGEYLIWRPRLSDAAYALIDPRRDLVPTGRVLNVPYDARGGLRVTTGYRLPGSGWDVGVTYTYFDSAGGAGAAAPPGGVLYPLLTRPGLVDQALRGAAVAHADYHAFDIDFGKTVDLDPHLSLRTFGGVRFASLDSCIHARYDGLQARLADTSVHSRFDGVGPTAGAEARLRAWRNLSLFGNVRGGLLFGDFTGERFETNNGVVTLDVFDRYSGIAPMAAIQLGGSWQWRALTLAAGYEVTHWFNAVTRPTVTDDFAEGKLVRRSSDLSFDGVFFRLAVGY